jgi:site-specific recombinase XerD
MNISFFPKKSKRSVSTLYIIITIDDQTQEISSGLKVNPQTWNSDNDIMEFTHNVRNKLLQVHNTLVHEKVNITAQRVKEAYLAKHVDVHTLVIELKRMIERDKVEVSIGNRSKSTVQKANVCLKHLTGFLASKRLIDITFDYITVSFLQELETRIKKGGSAHNTTKKHMDIVKKLFKYAKANKWTDKDPFYFYKIAERPVKTEPLVEYEVKLLLQKDLLPRTAQVRDVFIVQCFTGMSYSDVKQFNRETIYTDSSGVLWIDSKRVKTGVDYDVPLFPQVIKILEKYDYKLPVPSNQKMNAYLKEIGDVCGINKILTTHMARRTFASIMNERGVNITAIQRMLGHTKITTTQHYITTNRQFLKDEMKKASQSLGDMFDESL